MDKKPFIIGGLALLVLAAGAAFIILWEYGGRHDEHDGHDHGAQPSGRQVEDSHDDEHAGHDHETENHSDEDEHGDEGARVELRKVAFLRTYDPAGGAVGSRPTVDDTLVKGAAAPTTGWW